MPSNLTFRYRIKDSTSSKHLQRMGWAVNTVWNFCNEVSILAWRRERRWLTAYDLINLTAGSSKALGLHADTISEICREYATRRKQFRKRRLKWRSHKHSLGWIPFKVRFLRLEDDLIVYLGRRFRFWLSRPLAGKPKTGSFTQDARGRWYVNVQCEVKDPGTPQGETEIGIDLGLKDQATCSDGLKYNRENLTRHYADELAKAQRARKKRRVAAIHAKIKSARKDWAHKKTTEIVRRAKLIAVGAVSCRIQSLLHTLVAGSTGQSTRKRAETDRIGLGTSRSRVLSSYRGRHRPQINECTLPVLPPSEAARSMPVMSA